jgi:hypothetical protein
VTTRSTITQKNVSAGRDVNIQLNAGAEDDCSGTMHRLLDKLRLEREGQQTIRHTIDQLLHYQMPVDSGPVQGVEQKLDKAGRSDELVEASRLKEQFTKQIAKHWMYESAQLIFAHVLGLTRDRFVAEVLPAIDRGASRTEIDAIVVTRVIDQVAAELGPNELEMLRTDIRGMLFFLTGNCFLRWHRHDAPLPPRA